MTEVGYNMQIAQKSGSDLYYLQNLLGLIEGNFFIMADEFHMSLQSQESLFKWGFLDVLSKHNALFHMLWFKEKRKQK